MRYSVSTLGFPGISAAEVLALCAELGLDGIDFRTDYDGEHISPDISQIDRRCLRDAVRDAGMVISGLYSYAGRAPSVDADPRTRAADTDLIKRVVDLAVDLDCDLVRVFNGTKDRSDVQYERFIETVRPAGEYAQQSGVQIGLETHAELIFNAASARRVVEEIGLPNVVIIWDPANLQRAGTDPVAEAPDIWSLVRYIQLKDWRMPPGATRHAAVLMGEGEVMLRELIAYIKEQQYDGWISIEYEKKWHPELPEPATGIAHELDYLRAAFHSNA